MASWWVSHNQNYHQEREGGFHWAPSQTEAGLTPCYWANTRSVQPGDVNFTFVGGKIVAKHAGYLGPRPSDLGEGLWEDSGKKVEVEYRDFEAPLAIAGAPAELQQRMPDRYAPLNRFGTGNQGYLFALPPRAGRLLLDRIDAEEMGQATEAVEEGIGQAVADATERRALVLSRIGQGQFREALLGLWGGRCAVTGLDLPLLLRASHIKPWRDSDNRERLDPYNGLLLSPAYDAAFDAGLVAFGDDGRMMLSASLTPSRVERLGISPAAEIGGLQGKHRKYLDYHRESVFEA